MRRTKIVATLGPASGSPAVIGALLDAGADMVRLGLAHGTVEEHLAAIEIVRAAARDRGRQVGVLADLPGPKVRTGPFPEGGAFLAEGDEVTLSAGDGESDSTHISVDEPRLTDIASPGATIVLGDGTVTLTVADVDDRLVRTRVESGGRLQGRPGAHLPSDRRVGPVPSVVGALVGDELAVVPGRGLVAAAHRRLARLAVGARALDELARGEAGARGGARRRDHAVGVAAVFAAHAQPAARDEGGDGRHPDQPGVA